MSTLSTTPFLKTHGLHHRFPRHTLLQFDDWEIKTGEHWLLHGKSGSGKTTLLHIIGGLLPPSQGWVEMEGRSLYSLSKGELDKFRGSHTGIIFQQAHLIHSLSLFENLLAAGYFAGRKQDKERAFHLLDTLGLKDKARSYPPELSQGQRQRAGIARAVINSPSLIIADEPTSSLDDETAMQVIGLLKGVAAENKAAMIIATHDRRLRSHFPNTFTLNEAR